MSTTAMPSQQVVVRLGQQLKSLREHHEYSLGQVAELAAISSSDLAWIEEGKYTSGYSPSAHVLDRVAEVYGLEVGFVART